MIIVLVCAPFAFGQAITGFSGGNEYDSYYGDPAGDVIGWRFTVADDILITDLGVWNEDKTGGIESPHEVGIWDASKALITSVTVDNTGTVVGDWIYASITPVVIATGETYTIGAIYFASDDDWYISGASSVTSDPDVTWLNSVYPLGGNLGFVFPENDSSPSSGGRFGPNFILTETSLDRTTWGSIKNSF
ncbi:MAG: DUF4082 domain-containing protein [Candidatus Sabulitectum sp.]|nr:DUF4082 domain-containing protein [Candidatus Sabulitectum sp.]